METLILMSLVINADDFGKSEEVNKAIAECFDKGYIHRTTIMMNMPYVKEALEISEKNGFMDKVGIHLNITEGKPLTDSIKKLPDFCDKDGTFNAVFYQSKLKRLYMNKTAVDAIYTELKTQIDKYSEFGFTLFHVDSHHHSHTCYPVFKALKRLSKEYDFTSVRLSRNLYIGGSRLNYLYKQFYNSQVKKICKSTTELFGSYKDAKAYCKPEGGVGTGTVSFPNLVAEKSVEIMVHPMYSNDGVLMDSDTPFSEEITLYENK